MTGTFDAAALAAGLEDRFGGTEAERRVVVRQARDLADSGRFVADRGHPLTAETVLEELADAREGTPADRWNWWLGALDVAYGGYEPFQVRFYPGTGDDGDRRGDADDVDGSGDADDPDDAHGPP